MKGPNDMLTLGIRYLTGSVAASDVADRRHAEWPPHPGRVFMALAAAHFSTGDDPGERAALEWLETQPAPEIAAPDASERPVVTHYVPVNDKTGPSKAPLQSASGLTRTRQPRTFARAWLADDTVFLVWPDAAPDKRRYTALAELAGKVTRIGHSISLVQMWATQEAPAAKTNWLPDEARATERLRVPGEGSLRYLDRQFNREGVDEFFALTASAENPTDKTVQRAAKTTLKEKFQNQPPARLRPELSLSQGYAPRADVAGPAAPGTVFDPRLLIFPLRRLDGPYRQLDLVATLQLTEGLRRALLTQLGGNAPEILTGHRGNVRAERPHVAFLPLPFVGHERAHGGILGVALALPRDLTAPDRQRLLQALAGIRKEGLKLGPLGCWELATLDAGSPPYSLRDRTWTAAPAGARQWATVTPYVFDRHAKAKDKSAYQEEVASALADSCTRIDLPAPGEVIVTPVSAHLGAPPAHSFPRLPRKDGSLCRHTHAILVFAEPVVGPVLLGAGRYRGYGLCRPIEP
jgi:CRISPR-associated protein Csb2